MPSLLGEEVFAERVWGNQTFNGIDNLRQSLQTPDRRPFDLFKADAMLTTERHGIRHRLPQGLHQLLFVAHGMRTALPDGIDGQCLLQ